MSTRGRYAIITPYYKEPRSFIERCILSVRAQSLPTDHFLVADGHPQEWLDDLSLRHLKLDRSHSDFGNTPRGIGALLAIAEEYDGIGLLDADNWLETNHIEACLASASSKICDYVVTKRNFRRPDGTVMPLTEERNHIDTNCLFFMRGSFYVLPHWAMTPRKLSPVGDRYFLRMIAERPLKRASVGVPTVNYHCLWEVLYRMLGETPPVDAKPNVHSQDCIAWLQSLDPRQLEIAERLTGISLSDDRSLDGDERPARNALCPCGSGKRFKRCHGASKSPGSTF